jgi:aminodeoxyfutalosine deaminase
MMILRARVVLPMSRPAIRDGAVITLGNRVEAVGRWRDLSAAKAGGVVDLGESVLLPGLVNAHCHLDYTQMAGQFPPPRLFTDWIKLITATKAGWTYSEFARSWRSGAEMLLRTGTTTVADIEAVPQLLPEVWGSTPLRVFSFLEMIGITSRRPPRLVLKEVETRIATLRHPRCSVGLSPHAPYSTVPELLRLAARTARRRRLLVCTHVAESAPEFALFTRGEGEMFDWLQRSGRDMSDCRLGSPVEHLERCGLLDTNLLAIHANHLGPRDPGLLGERGVSVVHCPRSHFYFRHGPFPLRRLARAGVNICLGSDSLASVYKSRHQHVELNLFEEMRALAGREGSLSSRTLLRMATLNGARALGMQGNLGEIAPRAFADLIALPLPARSSNIYDAVVRHEGPVAASMIDGQWAIAPGSRPGPGPRTPDAA